MLITVLGSGAIGGYYGALLAKGGLTLSCEEIAAVARAERVQLSN